MKLQSHPAGLALIEPERCVQVWTREQLREAGFVPLTEYEAADRSAAGLLASCNEYLAKIGELKERAEKAELERDAFRETCDEWQRTNEHVSRNMAKYRDEAARLQSELASVAERQREKVASWIAASSDSVAKHFAAVARSTPLVIAEATERKPYREHARLLGILGMRAIRTEENADAIAAELDRWDAPETEQANWIRDTNAYLASCGFAPSEPAEQGGLPDADGHFPGCFTHGCAATLCGKARVMRAMAAEIRAEKPPQPASEGEGRPAWRDEPCDRTEGQCYDQRREKREAKARVAELESSLQSTRRELEEAKTKIARQRRDEEELDRVRDALENIGGGGDCADVVRRLLGRLVAAEQRSVEAGEALQSLRKLEQAGLVGFARYLQEQGCSLGEMTEAELADAAATYGSPPQPEQPDTKVVCTPGNVGAYLVAQPEQAKEPTMTATPKEMARRAREMFMDPHFRSAADIVKGFV